MLVVDGCCSLLVVVLFVVGCWLFCSLFVDCLVFVVCCLLFVVCCLLFVYVVCCLLCVVRPYLLFVVG